MKIGNHSSIQMKLFVIAPHKIKIGNNTNIGINCLLDGRRNLTIGSNVDINFNVKIFTLQHDIQSPDYHTKGGAVTIEDFACISSNSLILPNVKIGRGAVVAAGSVVTKDVPMFAIVAGIPAKKIGDRNRDLQYKLIPNPFPFH
jgi:maltose O-acetyltransferase